MFLNNLMQSHLASCTLLPFFLSCPGLCTLDCALAWLCGQGREGQWVATQPGVGTAQLMRTGFHSILVVTDASTSCPSAQLGAHLLQKVSPEVLPENSSSGIPSEQGDSQPWAEAGMCKCAVGQATRGRRTSESEFPQV